MQLACIKTIAAFMNSNGGDLFIGVSDDNTIQGIDRDLGIFGNDLDKLKRNISEMILNCIGINKKSFFEINFNNEIEEKTICHIKVKKNLHSKTWVNFF